MGVYALAQSVILQADGPESVRGIATTTQIVASVLTNLSVSGTLNPDVTGTNYVQVSNYGVSDYPQWSNSVNHFVIAPNGDPGVQPYSIYQYSDPANYKWEQDVRTEKNPTGTYSINTGTTGTATIVYWYQTNYLPMYYSVTVKGRANP